MRRYHLKQGDRSSTGGLVLEGDETCTHHGTALTYLGAKVECHSCGTVGVISGKGPRLPNSIMGTDAALEGDICLCKCEPSPIIIASQKDMFQEFAVTGPEQRLDVNKEPQLSNLPTFQTPRMHSQCVFVWDSVTGQPLENQRFIVDIEGEMRSARTDKEGYAVIETPGSETFRIHIVFSSPQRELTPSQRG